MTDTRIVILGGGFSGVEVAGEIADFLHTGDRILPELSPGLSKFALRKMTRRGLDIRLKARATNIDARTVELKDGERVTGGTIICTIGTTPTPLIESLPLPKLRGRVETYPDMSVPGQQGVWALGDCAHIVNAWKDQPAPPTAQFATREAEQLAGNMVACLHGKDTHLFHFRPLGALSTIDNTRRWPRYLGYAYQASSPG